MVGQRNRWVAPARRGTDTQQPVVPPADHDCFVQLLCGPRWLASRYPKPLPDALALAAEYRAQRIPARAVGPDGLPIPWRPSAAAVGLARQLADAAPAADWKSFALTEAECELLTLGGLVGVDRTTFRPVPDVLGRIIAAADAAHLEGHAC